MKLPELKTKYCATCGEPYRYSSLQRDIENVFDERTGEPLNRKVTEHFYFKCKNYGKYGGISTLIKCIFTKSLEPYHKKLHVVVENGEKKIENYVFEIL